MPLGSDGIWWRECTGGVGRRDWRPGNAPAASEVGKVSYVLSALTLNKDSASNSFLSLTSSLRASPPAGSRQCCWISAVFQGLDSALEISGRKLAQALFLPGLKSHRVGPALAVSKYRCGKQASTKESSPCAQPPCGVLSWSKGLSLSFLSLATRLGPLRRILQDSEEQLRSCRLGGRCVAADRAVGNRW